MSKRKTFQVVLEVPLLNGDKEKYTSHPEETDLTNLPPEPQTKKPTEEKARGSQLQTDQTETEKLPTVSEDREAKPVVDASKIEEPVVETVQNHEVESHQNETEELPVLVVENPDVGEDETTTENDGQTENDMLLRPKVEQQTDRTPALSECMDKFDQCLQLSDTDLFQSIQSSVNPDPDEIDEEIAQNDEIQVDEYNKESEALKKTLDPRLGQSDCAIDLQEEQNDDQTKHSKSITDTRAMDGNDDVETRSNRGAFSRIWIFLSENKKTILLVLLLLLAIAFIASMIVVTRRNAERIASKKNSTPKPKLNTLPTTSNTIPTTGNFTDTMNDPDVRLDEKDTRTNETEPDDGNQNLSEGQLQRVPRNITLEDRDDEEDDY